MTVIGKQAIAGRKGIIHRVSNSVKDCDSESSGGERERKKRGAGGVEQSAALQIEI